MHIPNVHCTYLKGYVRLGRWKEQGSKRCKNYMQTLPVSRSQLQVYLLHAIEFHANMAGVVVPRSWQQGSFHGA